MDGVLRGKFCSRQLSYARTSSTFHQGYYTFLRYQQLVDNEAPFYHPPVNIKELTQPNSSDGHRVRSDGHGCFLPGCDSTDSRDWGREVFPASFSNSQTKIKLLSRDVELNRGPSGGRHLEASRWQFKNVDHYQHERLGRQVHRGHAGQVDNIRLGKWIIGTNQVMEEVKARNDHISLFTFNCKHLQSMQRFLHAIHQSMFRDSISIRHTGGMKTELVIKRIKKVLKRNRCHHHVFVFHKTETLRASGEDHVFLAFLSDLVKADCQCREFKVSTIFTTYKRFSAIGDHFKEVQVDILSDPLDIVTMLQRYVPNACAQEYVSMCQRYLYLPEAVRRLAEEYLKSSIQPDRLQSIVCRDEEFWTLIFQKRVTDVKLWLTCQEINLIVNVLRCRVDTLTEAGIKQVYENVNPQHGYDHWSVCFQRLVKKYILLRSPINGSLMVHPLVQFFCKTSASPIPPASLNDHASKSWTTFLCKVLVTADQAMQVIGDKGHVFGYRADAWPYTKHLLEAAIHDTTGGYSVCLKVAVVARQLIMSSFPNEAKQFYSLLVQTAKYCSTARQVAVMEACLAMTTTLAKDTDWRSADHHFESALKILKKDGPAFFYTWTLRKRAITLHRQGHYMQSLKAFSEAKTVSTQMALTAQTSSGDDDLLIVPESQVQEDFISAEIHETIPLLFSGEMVKARNKLMSLCSTVKHLRHYPEYVILLNNIGLTYERDNGDYAEALKWYKKSYKERKCLEPLSPENLSAPMNNIGMILFQMGYYDQCEQYLQNVIAVRRKTEWQHFHTALTLFNLGRVKWATRRVTEAYQDSLEALNMLKKKFPRHHFTLIVRLAVAHIRLTIGQCGNSDSKVTLENLNEVLQFDKDMAGHDNLEGQHNIMSYHEHNVLIHWKQSLDAFSHHRNSLVKTYNEVSRRYAQGAPGFLNLQQRRKFVAYIQATSYERLDNNELVNLVATFCPSCRIARSVYDMTAWSQVLAVNNPALAGAHTSNSCTDGRNQLTSLNSALNISSQSENCMCTTRSTNKAAGICKGLSHKSEDISRTIVKCMKNENLLNGNIGIGNVGIDNVGIENVGIDNVGIDNVGIDIVGFRCDAEMIKKTNADQEEEILVLGETVVSELYPADCSNNGQTLFKLSLFHGKPVMQTSDLNQQNCHGEHSRGSQAQLELTRSSQEQFAVTSSSQIQHHPTRSSHMQLLPTSSSQIQLLPTSSSQIQLHPTRSSQIQLHPTRSSQIQLQPTSSSQIQLHPTSSNPANLQTDTGSLATLSINESNLTGDVEQPALCDSVNVTSFTVRDSGVRGLVALTQSDSLTSSVEAEFGSSNRGDVSVPEFSLYDAPEGCFSSLGMPELVSLSSPLVHQFYNYL
ncbi:hypothetical protein Btru_053816 [Bulinus truncatus]|nr:hypothetical protein Btru_053816 [Bulinus truncatus]